MTDDLVFRDGDRSVVAYGLVRLRRPRTRQPSRDPITGWVRTLTALEGYGGVDFALEYLAQPGMRRGQGRLEVTLFAADTRGDAAATAALAEDLGDLLHAETDRYDFVQLSPAEIRKRLDAVDPQEVAEVQRRSERMDRHPGVGFRVDRSRPGPLVARALWSFPVDGHHGTREDLTVALLSQDAPVSVRFLFHPTVLTDQEEGLIGQQLDELDAIGTPLAAAAARALASLLEVRPAFELQVLVASSQPLRPACVSNVGFAISPPRRSADRLDILTGGYEVVRERTGTGPLAHAYRTLRPQDLGEHDDRLRRLTDPWEVAAASRPPTADDGTFVGIDVAMPLLPGGGSTADLDGVPLGHAAGGGPIVLPHEDRFRHTYLLGQTGTGKSTLMLQMIADDLANDRGVAVIDPHGDLADTVLGMVPDHRVDDVVVVDPSDPEAVVGINLLEADDDLQREFLIAELCAWMYALYDPTGQGIVGPRFEQMLRYAALLLMDDQDPWSFMDIPLLFTDPEIAAELAGRAADGSVRDFWMRMVPLMRKSGEFGDVVAWFTSKFEPFRTVRPLRRVIGQGRSTFSLGPLMDRGGILVANLSKGRIGEYNARLLGFVVFARLWSATLARAQRSTSDRRDFFVYLDEAQTLTTSSLPVILSEARKYRLGVTLANQYFEQIPTDLRASVLGNVGTKVAFRMGARDASAFADQYGPEVEPNSLRRLPNFEAVAEVLLDGEPSEVQHLNTLPVAAPADAAERRERIRASSRRSFARPVEQIDADHDLTTIRERLLRSVDPT